MILCTGNLWDELKLIFPDKNAPEEGLSTFKVNCFLIASFIKSSALELVSLKLEDKDYELLDDLNWFDSSCITSVVCKFLDYFSIAVITSMYEIFIYGLSNSSSSELSESR